MEYDKFYDAVPEFIKRLVDMHEVNSKPIKDYQTWEVMTWFGMAAGGLTMFGGGEYIFYGIILLIGCVVWRSVLKIGYEKALESERYIDTMIRDCGWIYSSHSGLLKKANVDSQTSRRIISEDYPE